MNPFINPEFWLSLAFFVVLGFMFIPVVQRKMENFFNTKRQAVENQIQENKSVYQEAVKEYKTLLKASESREENKEIKNKIKQIEQEFLQKERKSIDTKKQDFQVRQKMIELQSKENLKKQLLDKAEEEILNVPRTKTADFRDVEHFIKMLHKNEEKLKALLD